jgi:hypothetical protein
MSLEFINSIILNNYKSIVECAFITDAIDIATQTQIDKLFEMLNKLIICTRFTLSYVGYLPTLSLSNILSFLKKNKDILLFNIFPIKNDGQLTNGACFSLFNSLDGIHDVGMINIKCFTNDLLELFSLITVYRWILLNDVPGITSQVIEYIGIHSNAKILMMTGCGANLNFDVTVLQRYFKPAAGESWNTVDMNALVLRIL